MALTHDVLIAAARSTCSSPAGCALRHVGAGAGRKPTIALTAEAAPLATLLQYRPAARALIYWPPAPEAFLPSFTAWPAALTRPASPAKETLKQIRVLLTLNPKPVVSGL